MVLKRKGCVWVSEEGRVFYWSDLGCFVDMELGCVGEVVSRVSEDEVVVKDDFAG